MICMGKVEMGMAGIENIRFLISEQKILWTEHVALRMRDRGIKRTDVIHCINNGEIIENYPNDMPYPSCLINGISASGNALGCKR